MYLPNKNRLILGVSSCWIIILIDKAIIIKDYISVLLLTNITIASLLFWYKYTYNSFYHYNDVYSVKIYGCYLLYKSYNNFDYLLAIKIKIILLLYLLSYYFTIIKKYNLQLLSHLLFRFIFFTWSYNSLSLSYSLSFPLLLPIIHFGHNYYLYMNVSNINNYLNYLLQTLLIVIIYLSIEKINENMLLIPHFSHNLSLI